MARFRFSLQNVLDIKVQMESMAKQEFSAAAAYLSEEEEKLRRLYSKKESLEEEAKKLLLGNLNFRDIDDNQLAIMQTKELVMEQEKAVEKAKEALERARVKMAEAVMERKTYERLREKAFEEYRLEENRAEGKTIDELTSYVHGRKALSEK
ncbi:MAG: flagellar export protein FliJ [Lachnospiraceae bacterium]|nr:flagellar export protein FliJ [Lachnospiraceae bacterium]MBR1650716.1 flagellar export protein FliJ [Lachnospiraceae bacterium]